MKLKSLENKTAIITGSARGIGYGIAHRFAQEGANVVISDINTKQALESVDRIISETGGRVASTFCDVTNKASVEELVAFAISEFGSLDIAVANAGICPFEDIMQMDVSTWQKTVDVNLTGAFYTAQVAGNRMIEQGKGGRIIFITSLATIKASSAQADYAATKSGVKMLMASMAGGLGKHNITCNAVAPGVIYTEMGAFWWDVAEHREAFNQENPIGRLGEPKDIANAALFLALEDSEYITGTTIRVDGGREAIG